jgi:signal transduction histidine kinase
MLRDVTDRVRQEEALEVERERLDFLNAMLRHHVLNGMNVVIATAERLAAEAEGKRRRRLEIIHRRGTAIVDLVGTIRSLVRTIQRDEASGFGPVDLDATLRRSIEAVEAQHEDATVTVDGIDADLAVSADAMLETVFEDLIENAIRHNDRPDPEVRVLVEADEGTVSVNVEDDGPGIPDTVRRDVFDDGMTGDRSGFGLHVVHLLVTLYDGSLSISDRDPRGTVVTVTLPRATQPGG